MAVPSASKRDVEVASTLTQLVEAEQRWRDELAETDRECVAALAATRDKIERAAQAFEAELAVVIEQRRRELSADIDGRIALERTNAHERAAALGAIDGDALEQLVRLVLARVSWPEDVT